MRSSKENIVRLTDPATNLVITGQLTVLGSGGVEVKGTAEGISADNYMQIRPKRMHGFSSRWGQVWIDRIYKFEPTVRPMTAFPAIVRLRAIDTFFGDFDPRHSQVTKITASLGRLESLFPFQPYQQHTGEGREIVRSYKVMEEPLRIYSKDDVEVTLQNLISVGAQVSFRRTLSAEFKTGADSTTASEILDSVLLLISVLTQHDVRPRAIEYWNADSKITREKKAAKRRREPTKSYYWLVDQRDMVPLLQRIMGSWLGALANAGPRTVVQWFLAASHHERAVESRFLSFCQCFEDLNRRRIGDAEYASEAYDADVFKPMQSAIKALDKSWINADLRRRLSSTIREGNRWRLGDRIRETMKLLPEFSRVVRAWANDIRYRIEGRRNKLSHGNPLGGVSQQSEFGPYPIE